MVNQLNWVELKDSCIQKGSGDYSARRCLPRPSADTETRADTGHTQGKSANCLDRQIGFPRIWRDFVSTQALGLPRRGLRVFLGKHWADTKSGQKKLCKLYDGHELGVQWLFGLHN